MKSRISFLLSLSAITVALSTSASARTPETVITKSQKLTQVLRRSAHTLDSATLALIETSLNRALNVARVGGVVNNGPIGPVPGPLPLPLPPRPGHPYSSECKVLGPGSHRGFSYSFRMTLNGEVIEATDHLSTILSKFEQYVADGMCVKSLPEACQLLGHGNFRGFSYSYRIAAGPEVIMATDHYSTAKEKMNTLRTAGVCF